MLRWLPNALYKPTTERQRFLHEIICVVFIMHVMLFLLMIGFDCLQKKDQYAISLHQAGATYVLMPLQKHVQQKAHSAKSRDEKNALRKSQLLNYDAYQEKLKQNRHKPAVQSIDPVTPKVQTVQAKAAAPQQISKVAQKSEPRATMKLLDKKSAIKSPAVRNKKQPAKQQASKQQKKPQKTTIKSSNKTDSVTASTLPEKSPTAPAVPQVTENSEKNIAVQPTKHDVEAAVTQELPAQNVTTENTVSETASTLDGNDENLDDVIFIGYGQLDKCMVSAKIQHAIEHSWEPPVGAAPGLTCQVKVEISAQGQASNVVIEKSSQVRVYDNAARRALLQVEYPPEVYNKTISIVLGN